MKQFFNNLKYKKYILYHLRWQSGFFVFYPVFRLLDGRVSYVAEIILSQFIGAVIFWWIDKYIFRK